ncbi:olfactory receptor 1D2-like [Engraulis encrasicolus]|uniref:olfactory receptor 1D2-like n=1 Tax=Engraulis encrasicolus TaxID=184585 RepID=UPI002FD66F94
MILAIMGYDRYAAICTPLHYHNKMSPRNVALFVALSWLFPLVQVRMRLKAISHGTALFMSIYFLLMPPLLNPVIYVSE